MLTVWTLLIYAASAALPSTTMYRTEEACLAQLQAAVRRLPDTTEAQCVQTLLPAGLVMGRR